MAIRKDPKPGLPAPRVTGSTGPTGPVQGPINPKGSATGSTGSKNKLPSDFGAGDSGVYGTRLDPMAEVTIGGKKFASGIEAANYLIQLRYSGKTAEYNRLVGLLKANGY